MARALKILTVNWHVPYLCLLAKTGHEFFVIEPVAPSGRRRWDHEMRPPPDNVRILDDDTWRRGLEDQVFDLVISHNHMDLLDLIPYSVPKILVLHNRLSTSLEMGDGLDERDRFWNDIFMPLYQSAENIRFVSISAAKKADWRLPARVILPGIDVDEYQGWRGDTARVLRVGNFMKERDLMMGFTEQEAVVRDLPTTILGINPTVPESRLTKNFEDLRDQLKAHRVFLNTTVHPWEDGYNLAMLEAMATGMPVVSTANETSPIVDGVNGYISSDPDELHDRLRVLLDDKDLAAKLGDEARATVAEKFPIKQFVDNWNDVIADSVRVRREKSTVLNLGSAPVQRRRILMGFTANPTTTASYIERGLRKDHEVVTCGPTISDEVLESWDMVAVKDRVEPQDIPLDEDLDIQSVMAKLPAGFEPDLFLWVESGINFMPPDLGTLECPKAAYFIDSHINLEWHTQWARMFDYVFVAQRAYLDDFRRAGCGSVHWLPLGCDPEIHGSADENDKEFDISFVGSITPHNPRRRELLDRLTSRIPIHIERCFLEDMAAVFSRSRIVFNTALRQDLNMRVFEVMSCGSMLLSDEAPGSGFEDFFKHDVHYALYSDESLPDTADRYLGQPETCERIAAEGRREVLAHHTYEHRGRQIVRTVFEGAGTVPTPDIAKILQRVPQTAARILVCGGVTSDLVRPLKEMGFAHVAAFEMDLEFATSRTTGLFSELLTGSPEMPCHAGDPFDVIVMADMLERVATPHRLFENLSELLAPGGTIVLSVYNARWFGFVEDIVEGRCATSATFDGRRVVRPLTLADIHTALALARLEPETVVAVTTAGAGHAAGSETARFGRMSLHGLDETAIQELYTTQFIVVVKEAKDEFLEQVETAFDNGDYEDALSMLAGPMAETRQLAAMLLRGRCHEAMDRIDEAGKAYRGALDENESSVEALLGLTRVALALDNTEDACKHIDRTAELDLEQTETVERGRLLLRLDRPEQAFADFQTALDNDAICRDAVLGLVEAARATNLESAGPHLDRYLGLRGADMEVLVEAARIDVLCGNTSTAIDRLETAIMFNPGHEEATQLLNEIRNE